MPAERAMIFIDGSNFYHSLKKSFTTARIDIEKFCNKLALRRQLEGIYYYTASINQNDFPIQYSAQQKFLMKLSQINHLHLFMGRLEKHEDNQLLEKGVDVKLAVDMLMKAVKNEYDTCFLVSNDADFVPAIEEIQKLNKTVIHVTFPKMLSFHLDKICDRTILISSISDVLITTNDESKK